MRVHNQQNKQHKVIQNAVAVGFTKSVAGDCKYTFHFIIIKVVFRLSSFTSSIYPGHSNNRFKQRRKVKAM